MLPTHEGLAEIEESEGFSAIPYLDKIPNPPVWTAYFGETDGIGPHSPRKTRAQAEESLKKIFAQLYAWALKPFEELQGFNQNMYNALASFIWNCGTGAVASTTRVGRFLRLRRWREAADAMLEWNKSGGRPIQGLIDRRNRERKLFLTPMAKSDTSYLTPWERATIKALNDQRAIAHRHGGWDKVDRSHLKNASQLKSNLRARLDIIAEGTQQGRAHRRAIISAAIG